MITTKCLKLGKSVSVPWVVHPGVGQELSQDKVRCDALKTVGARWVQCSAMGGSVIISTFLPHSGFLHLFPPFELSMGRKKCSNLVLFQPLIVDNMNHKRRM